MNEHYGNGLPATRLFGMISRVDNPPTETILERGMACYRNPIRDLFFNQESLFDALDRYDKEQLEFLRHEASGRGY